MIELVIAGAIGAFGYVKSRRFVKDRLRYVDGVRKPYVPLLAGGATAAAAVPVVSLLPVLGPITAVVVGAGVGAGVASGRKDIEETR